MRNFTTTEEEKKPILTDSGIYVKWNGLGQANLSGQQHLVIQPVEFDTRHKNYYGYLSLLAFLISLTNYLIIQHRPCQFSFNTELTNYDLIQSFHLTALIIGLVVFLLSYFNFALVLSEFKLLFYASLSLIFICAGLLLYNSVAIFSAPCVSGQSPVGATLFEAFGVGAMDASNIFSAKDASGITVFLLDLIGAIIWIAAGRLFYKL